MFCIRHKSSVALIALILVTAILLHPGVALARPHGLHRTPDVPAGGFLDMLWTWILKAGWGMDPNGNPDAAPNPDTDAGWGMDPNGSV